MDRNGILRSYPILSDLRYPKVLAIIVPKTLVLKLYLKDVNNLLYHKQVNYPKMKEEQNPYRAHLYRRKKRN